MIVGRHGGGVKSGLGAAVVLPLLLIWSTPVWAEASHGPLTALLGGARAFALGRIEPARQLLLTVPVSKRSPEVSASIALTYLAHGQRSKARKMLQHVTDVAPTMAEAHYWLAVAALRQGDLQGATDALDVAVSLAADQPSYRLARGLAFRAAGRQQEAAEEVLAAAKREPNLLNPLYHPDERRGVLGFAESGLGKHPQRSLVDETITLLFLEAGLLADAKQRSTKSKSAMASEVLGRLALDHGDPGRALVLLEKASSARPRSARARFHLARAAFASGADARALATLQEAARIEPRDARVQTALGDIYLKQGDLDRGELAYGYSLAQKLDSRALSGLGRVLELQGDLDGALRHYRKAVALAPASVAPLERLARLLERNEPRDPQAKALRLRLKAATKLDEDIVSRVGALGKANRSHASSCAQISLDPADAVSRLSKPSKVGRAARAFARAAALEATGQEQQALGQAKTVLKALSARRWAKGAHSHLVFRRKIGKALVVRVIPMEYVVLD